MMWTCAVCKDELVLQEMVAHFNLKHPTVPGDFETWPDGGPVIHDADPSAADCT